MSLKEAKKQLHYAFDDGLISDEECLLLYDLNRLTNLDFPYEQYPLFDLDDMQNDECLAEVRRRLGSIKTTFLFWQRF